MPIDPDAPGRLALTLFRLASGVEIELTKRIAATLAKGIDAPGWQERQFGMVASLNRELERTIGAFIIDGRRAAGETIAQGFTLGITAGAADLRPVLSAPLLTSQLPGARALLPLAEELAGTIESTKLGVLRSAADIFRTVVARTVGSALLGTQTRRGVAQQVLNQLISGGISGFTDVSGRRWQLASYVEMATRTATQRAMTQGHTDVLQSRGHDLIIVSNAPAECRLCRPWENKILSLSGYRGALTLPSAIAPGKSVTVEVAGSLDEAKRAGLYHPSCRHSHAAYLPGLTKPPPGPAADPEGDAARQRLRALERQVRRAKLQEAAALDPAAATAARADVRRWQTAIRQHVSSTPGLLRQRQREQIGTAR